MGGESPLGKTPALGSASHFCPTGLLARLTSSGATGIEIVAPGLSMLVGGMKGPIVDGELPKCAEFVGGLIPQP